MPFIQGFATHAAGAELLPYKYDPGDIKPNEVEIAISHCGICRSDIHMVDNNWGISQYPLIPGHEIVGKITVIGSGVLGLNSGDRVGVGWMASSCGQCEWCLQGEENMCSDSQGTCVHRNGGYADRVRVNARFAIPIPEGLESERAAPLLCGGVTVYNPIRTHGVNPASRVGIVGIGGLGHMAVQFAHAFGAEVTAFSSSPAKEADARSLGAEHFGTPAKPRPSRSLPVTSTSSSPPSRRTRIGVLTSRHFVLTARCALSVSRRESWVCRCFPWCPGRSLLPAVRTEAPA